MCGYVGFAMFCFRCWMHQWSESVCRSGAVDDMAQVIMCDGASSVIYDFNHHNLVGGIMQNIFWVSKIMHIILWMLQLQWF